MARAARFVLCPVCGSRGGADFFSFDVSDTSDLPGALAATLTQRLSNLAMPGNVCGGGIAENHGQEQHCEEAGGRQA